MAINIEIQPNVTVLLSGNPMWFKVSTDTDITATLRLNAVIYYRLDPLDVFSELTRLQLPYDPFSSYTRFDVRKLIDAAITYPLIQVDFLHINRVSAQYYIGFFENNIPDETPLAAEIASNTFTVIKGVTDRLKASEASFYNFASYYQLRCLTEMPRTRKIYGDNALVISLINLIASVPETYYKFDFLAKYENDDQLSGSSSLTLPFAYSGNFYFLPSQIESFLGPPPVGVPLRSLCITISAETAPGVFTQMDEFLFLWHAEPAKRLRHFMWRNNLGGLDFLTCTGILEQKFGSKMDIVQHTVASNDYTSQYSDLAIANVEPGNAYRINTGMKLRGELDSLLAMFYSKQQFLYLPDLNESDQDFWFLPIISKMDGPYRKDKDYIQGIPFDFQLGFNANTHFPLK